MTQKYQRCSRKRWRAATDGRVPSLLLHSCCAPCSSYVLEYLSDFFRITVFYYNPNIDPEEEYHKRVEEQKETQIQNQEEAGRRIDRLIETMKGESREWMGELLDAMQQEVGTLETFPPRS